MFELIISAIILGFMLSLVFIGPIFFLLIETSFSRGPKHALALDIGVISADLLCIVAAYYASADIVTLIDKHPGFYRITSILIFAYGIVMMVTKTKMHMHGEEKFISQNYVKTFANGFFFNLLNVGVILFWLVTVISVRNQYPDTGNFILYIGIVIATYLGIDLAKIFLAKQFHDKLTQKLANQIRRIVGGILIVFSFFIFLQSFKKFNQFDKRLEEAEKKEVKYQKHHEQNNTSGTVKKR
ncbi:MULTISPECIES: LysE family translocator [Chryseobacterium]|uniref:Threonine/homoserine/homoserine lactone efflux protein n=1 Tax=Chryseobacterium camelliae TaxID=1265445 RepID=A0ABU0TPL7_9FLAO|nr:MULTISPECIES: LysE family transporter [Chryseobacterium]MDQ1098208.1 threonine/homoserine/homoserine lactone efflux protein [Chryseobacterium camelliae]MDQ1102139.1 threonine/homoserine/homoserine lactone efflux protein [Chryseobacterium sp. SORGH_AS_1048]MDR6129938.1 threonine/homoserine/homoserine lactone efflux protein [Chryseobacterium sp. SORGH_AS_1175]MDT3407932.1 threonine/homoserine/homoserine lactone efflux protein [Pseudacidovorax intermedius]